MYTSQQREQILAKTFKSGAKILLVAVITMAVIIGGFKMVEYNDSDELLGVQSLRTGDITWHSSAGIKPQFGGKLIRYPKTFQYEFLDSGDDPTSPNLSDGLPLRFNDGGTATLFGSARVIMPRDSEALDFIYAEYGSIDALDRKLIDPVIVKAVYNTGNLLSARQSYGERRGDIITFIEDMANNGVYATTARDTLEIDVFSGEQKRITIAEIVENPNAPNGKARVENSLISQAGIVITNLSIAKTAYDPKVSAQIDAQRDATMAIQTAIAEARRAEQDAIKAEAEGRARAAVARAEQEVLKAQNVTAAEAARDVASLDLETARLEREAKIERAEGDAEAKSLVFEADGALEQKLAALVKINQAWAAAAPDLNVPTTVFGSGSGTNSLTQSDALMQLLMANQAKQLGIDLEVQ